MDKRSRRGVKVAASPANETTIPSHSDPDTNKRSRPSRAAAKAPRRDVVCLDDEDVDCAAAPASDADRSGDESSGSSPVKAKKKNASKKAPQGRGKKQVRMQRAAALTTSGERADLSSHALGRLFLATVSSGSLFLNHATFSHPLHARVAARTLCHVFDTGHQACPSRG